MNWGDSPLTRHLRNLVPIGEGVVSLAAATALSVRGGASRVVVMLAGIDLLGMLPYLARIWLGLAAGMDVETKLRRRGRNRTIELPLGGSRTVEDMIAHLQRVGNLEQRRHRSPRVRRGRM